MDKKMTIGNYTGQANKDFPIDCELFNAIQDNTILLSVLGNIAGDKTILKGCELEKGDTARKPGYVFLRTREFPDGEILYWEGGNLSAGMYLKIEAVPVSAQGYEYPQAYTVRSLAPGIGVENYSWNEFKAFKTNLELDSYSKKQDEDIAKLSPIPLGVVQIWAGKEIPANYELCEGQQLKTTDYPELYAAIGTTYNDAFSSTGSRYSTTSGYFRLPDLRGRFLTGYNVSDNDYSTYGKVGGEKQHILKPEEIPAHSHKYTIYKTGDDDYGRYSYSKNGDSPQDEVRETKEAGGGQPHENRPPYYTLAYIMRVR